MSFFEANLFCVIFPKINPKTNTSEHEKDKTMQTSNELIPYYALELDNPQHNKKVKQKKNKYKME